jgi:hypothetical protein
MGKATTIVYPYLRDKLRAHVDIICESRWGGDDKIYLEFLHPDAPDGHHVDVILDEEGLRFKIDCDV